MVVVGAGTIGEIEFPPFERDKAGDKFFLPYPRSVSSGYGSVQVSVMETLGVFQVLTIGGTLPGRSFVGSLSTLLLSHFSTPFLVACAEISGVSAA